MPLELYPHQVKALKEIHNGCVVKGGVGTGKSRVSLAYYWTRVTHSPLKINGYGFDGPPAKDIPLYIITTAKKRDDVEWEEEAAHFGISAHEGAGNGVKLVVDSWNNIPKYADVKDAFFIFDEQRLVGSGAWVKAFLKIAQHNQWIVLSATPGDSWMDYCPIFIANGFYKNRTEFVNRHVKYSNFSKFPKIDRYVEQDILEAYRQQVLVDMPYARHTQRISRDVLVDHDKALFDQVWNERWNPFKDEPIRDVAEMFITARRVVNGDPARLNGLMRIMEKHDRVIVFYNHNYELEMLRTLEHTLGIPVAEWNGHKHQPIPDTKKWLYLVQYRAGAEGWNCITTDAMVFYSMTYSWKDYEQSHGRIDRLNTPYTELYYYTLKSSSEIDRAISKALKTKRNFNEKVYVKNWAPFPAEVAEAA